MRITFCDGHLLFLPTQYLFFLLVREMLAVLQRTALLSAALAIHGDQDVCLTDLARITATGSGQCKWAWSVTRTEREVITGVSKM